MEKIEFEKKIIDVLVKAGYMRGGQLAKKIFIAIDLDRVPEIEIRFFHNDNESRNIKN